MQHNAVIVMAEGYGKGEVEDGEDAGVWLKNKINDHFKQKGEPVRGLRFCMQYPLSPLC